MSGTGAQWMAAQGRVGAWRYTRTVASLLRRLTSLAVVIALSGSPAALSACMAFCLQGVATAASNTGSQSDGHATHTSVATPAVDSAHVHHGSPASNESTAPAATTPSSHDQTDVRLSAICTDCCPDGQVVLAAGRGVERTDAKSFSAAPAVAQVASFRLTTSGLGASPPSPPGPPASPTSAPLVLRI